MTKDGETPARATSLAPVTGDTISAETCLMYNVSAGARPMSLLPGASPAATDATVSNPLHGLQREVPFTSFDATHVGPVDAGHVREGLLAALALLPVAAQVDAQGPLEVSFHDPHRAELLLDGLHTDK